MDNILEYEYNEHVSLLIKIHAKEITVFNYTDIKIKLEHIKLQRVHCVIINMDEVEYVDSSGLAMFIKYKQMLDSLQINLTLDKCCKGLIGSLGIMNISDLFKTNCHITTKDGDVIS